MFHVASECVLEGQKRTNPREGIETLFVVFVVSRASRRQKRTNPREGIETLLLVQFRPLRTVCCQKRTNPREGIETLYPITPIILVFLGVGKVRKERIPVRGLKHNGASQDLDRDFPAGQKRTNPREGIETFLCRSRDGPRVGIGSEKNESP